MGVPGRRLARYLHVDSSRALIAGLCLIGDLGTFLKRAEAVAGDRALMDKEVFRAIIRGDEAETLFVAEPLHGSTGHMHYSSTYVRRTQRVRQQRRRARARFARRFGLTC